MTEDKYKRPGDPAARLAELREGKKPAPAADEALLETGEALEEGGEAFSVLSAARMQKVMVEFRFKNGNAKALAYSYLVSIDLDPSAEIVMDFSVCKVRLVGRNLRPLFAALLSQRAAFVQETDELHAEATIPKDATVITQIELKEGA
jgi:hypothetical protein